MMAGASADQTDRHGDTALGLATENGHSAVARTLRELRGLCV